MFRAMHGLALAGLLAGLVCSCNDSSSDSGLASISVTPAAAVIGIGERISLSACAFDAAGQALSGVAFVWSSASPELASVDDSGQVTGLAEGQARIEAASGGVRGAAEITVRQDVAQHTLRVTVQGRGTVASDPAGIDCRGVCEAAFTAGSSVILSAAPDSGASFSGFGGDCSGREPCSLHMDGDKAVSARFGLPFHTTAFFVDRAHHQASDDNPGSQDEPWLTVSHAAAVLEAGQTVYVRAGTYDERVRAGGSGTADGYINYAGYPGDARPVVRGFDVSDRRYLRIIGFEITHDSLEHSHGIVIANGSDHVEVLDNDIHHVRGHAVRWYNHQNSYITVRGNEIDMAACPDVAGACEGNGWAVQMAGGHHLLVEYNHAQRVGDFVNVHATQAVVRNNYLHDFQNAYWPDGGGDALHADMFQPAGSSALPSQYQVYESNFMGDNIELNSHILQMRTQDGSPDHHILFRGNVGYRHGSYAMQCGGVDNVYYYHNTIHAINARAGWAAPAARYNSEGADDSLDNSNFNNLYSEIGDGPPLSVEAGCACTASHNGCQATGAHESCAFSGDLMLVDPDGLDFHLRQGSPAIGLGKPITSVSSPSGSGSSFEVEQADLLCDGYGVVEGDRIAVGGGEPVRITGIAGDTISVDRSISWSTGDGVTWRDQDAAPDAGAFEFDAAGYDFALGLSSPADGAEVSGQVELVATVDRPERVRFVVFYVDGVPAAQVLDSPYTAVWDASDEPAGSGHLLEARAYPLHAGTTLWQSDEVSVSVE
ncbi:MAG: Ig-like domain-containing protein [Deltaproteobacteria bacterium]|nr:Ig-like domain-containing protein [Deltaproteobacteria bacterium]